MIGKLKGVVDSISEEYLILDVNGVGYLVFCSSKLLAGAKIGDTMSLMIQTVVREDSITLFGFMTSLDKDCFETLCKVNGVGNKMAMKIMSALTVSDIMRAVGMEDTKAFCRAQGVGQKIAARIVAELKDIKKTVIVADLNETSGSQEMNTNDNRLNDSLSALENLGYQRSLAYNIVSTLLKERENIVLESLITEALKRLNKF